MNDMNNQHLPDATPETLMALGGPNLVYIRTISVADIGDMPGLEDVAEDTPLYAVHAADGRCVAVMADREAAFIAARHNEMNPVSVH